MFHFRIQFLCPRWKYDFYSTYCRRNHFISSSSPPKIIPFTSLQSVALSKRSYWALLLGFGCFDCRNLHRYFSVRTPNEMPNVHRHSVQRTLGRKNSFPRDLVMEIIDKIRNNEKDLASRLNFVASSLSVYVVIEIFKILNCQRVCGLSFFEWICSNLPRMNRNARVCSLIIDNLGRLEDYESMLLLLKKFSSSNICLMYEAFVFLSFSSSLQDSTKRVLSLLNEASGSCRNSGVHALVEMFCKVDLFEMASYVIKITESKESYYFLLIREKCGRGLIEDARGIIKDMEEANCALTTRVYNCILGSLYKNGQVEEAMNLLDEMKEVCISPDAMTFEIIIRIFCGTEDMDGVRAILDGMVSQGIKPRVETHTAIIKSLCAAEKYDAAHQYLVESAIICKKVPINTMHSLLAKLYLEKGDDMSAHYTLVEMMDKGIEPNGRTYMNILKQLLRIGRKDLARDLEDRHSQFLPRFQS